LLLALTSSAAAQDHAGSPIPDDRSGTPIVEARIEGGLLTLQADGAPLADVLRAIGAAGEFEVVLRGAFAMPVSAAFADRPLEDAIRELLAGHSLVIRRDDPDPGTGAAKLTNIRVMENPDLAASEEAIPSEPSQQGLEAGVEDDADEELLDREAFRLAKLGVPPPTREGILLELDDPDPAARVAAVPKVGSLAPGAAISVLSGVFAEEDDPLVRSRAVAALTRLEAPGARALLRERALGDADVELRMQALNALASSAGERSINLLAQALRQDPEPAIRVTAVRALGRVGGDWARRSLERAARDPDPVISTAAEEALAVWSDAE
jgi:hypothetical protein